MAHAQLRDPLEPRTPTGPRRVASAPCAEGLIVRMLDSDLLEAVFTYIDGGVRLAVWLTCREFNALRPVGNSLTSVHAIYTTAPAMLEWATAIGIGCPPPQHLSPQTARTVLQTLGELEPVAFATYIGTIVQMIQHPDNGVSIDATKTACVLLNKLTELEPLVLAMHVGCITELLNGKHRRFYRMSCDAERALTALVCKLGGMGAHVQLACVITATLCHSDDRVRMGALNALEELGFREQKAFGLHTGAVVRFLLDAGVRCATDTSWTWACCRALGILGKLEPAALVEFAGIVVEMLWHSVSIVRRVAIRTLGRLEQTALTPHMAAIVRKLVDRDADLREQAVEALGMLESAALAQHVGVIAGLLQDSDSDVRNKAVVTLGKLAAADLATRSVVS